MARRKIEPHPVCDWREDDDGIWHTGCGTSFFFDTDGPAENKFNFCYHCGAKLRPVPASSPQEQP